MSYLLDTNVISEMVRETPQSQVSAWFQRHQWDPLFVSAITIGEIEQGIARLPASSRREALAAWLNDTLLVAYADHILPLDVAVLRCWGRLTGELLRQGRKLPVIDALLAATALEHGLTLVTRNVGDFAGTGVSVLNPWA